MASCRERTERSEATFRRHDRAPDGPRPSHRSARSHARLRRDGSRHPPATHRAPRPLRQASPGAMTSTRRSAPSTGPSPFPDRQLVQVCLRPPRCPDRNPPWLIPNEADLALDGADHPSPIDRGQRIDALDDSASLARSAQTSPSSLPATGLSNGPRWMTHQPPRYPATPNPPRTRATSMSLTRHARHRPDARHRCGVRPGIRACHRILVSHERFS